MFSGVGMRFSIANARGVALAEIDIDRPMTIIVGSNGSGKSTILNHIRQQTYGQHIYMGPHRATRRQNARLRFMGGSLPAMSDLMSSPSLNGYEGVTLTSGSRDAWELDEAGNFFKYNLSKIEFQRSSAISQLYDTAGSIPTGRFSDIWGPLKELTSKLLPHLSFSRVEISNYDNMRCLFKVHGKGVEVDFDDLSSGEKGVLQTLYPIIESEIFNLLNEISTTSYSYVEKKFVIFDEPELHLHPSLQEKLVNYLRGQAITRDLHVILATHSPTIIDAADQDEIFLIRPSDSVNDGENQAIALGNNPAKLSIIQESIGSVLPVTAARPILFVEGSEKTSIKNYSDKEIYMFLDPRFLNFNIIPGNGKEECLNALRSSRRLLQESPFSIKVFALVDRDNDSSSLVDEGAFELPVCMIENMVLSDRALQAEFGSLLHLTPFQDIGMLSNALASCVDSVTEMEVSRRFKRYVRLETFGLGRDVTNAQTAERHVIEFKSRLDHVDFAEIEERSRAEVKSIKESGEALQFFSGKNILQDFYRKHVERLSITKAMFTYNAARKAAGEDRVKAFLNGFFAASLNE